MKKSPKIWDKKPTKRFEKAWEKTPLIFCGKGVAWWWYRLGWRHHRELEQRRKTDGGKGDVRKDKV